MLQRAIRFIGTEIAPNILGVEFNANGIQNHITYAERLVEFVNHHRAWYLITDTRFDALVRSIFGRGHNAFIERFIYAPIRRDGTENGSRLLENLEPRLRFDMVTSDYKYVVMWVEGNMRSYNLSNQIDFVVDYISSNPAARASRELMDYFDSLYIANERYRQVLDNIRGPSRGVLMYTPETNYSTSPATPDQDEQFILNGTILPMVRRIDISAASFGSMEMNFECLISRDNNELLSHVHSGAQIGEAIIEYRGSRWRVGSVTTQHSVDQSYYILSGTANLINLEEGDSGWVSIGDLARRVYPSAFKEEPKKIQKVSNNSVRKYKRILDLE